MEPTGTCTGTDHMIRLPLHVASGLHYKIPPPTFPSSSTSQQNPNPIGKKKPIFFYCRPNQPMAPVMSRFANFLVKRGLTARRCFGAAAGSAAGAAAGGGGGNPRRPKTKEEALHDIISTRNDDKAFVKMCEGLNPDELRAETEDERNNRRERLKGLVKKRKFRQMMNLENLMSKDAYQPFWKERKKLLALQKREAEEEEEFDQMVGHVRAEDGDLYDELVAAGDALDEPADSDSDSEPEPELLQEEAAKEKGGKRSPAEHDDVEGGSHKKKKIN